ncbi:MAG: helix-turn-helix transcriptional regulator [Polyangiaceae bacterium]
MAATPNLGPRLRQARERAGLTQAELAEKADVADATLSRIERNRFEPSMAIVKRLADSLRVGVDELLAGKKPDQRPSLRRSEARLLATVRDLDDATIDDITKGVRLIMGAARRSARRV